MLSFIMSEFYSELSEVSHVTSTGIPFHVAPFHLEFIDDEKKS